nr:MAG TPA: hypothetical protein [Caudoviricetes sp.]
MYFKLSGNPIRWQKGNDLRLLCPAYVVAFTPTDGFFSLKDFKKARICD